MINSATCSAPTNSPSFILCCLMTLPRKQVILIPRAPVPKPPADTAQGQSGTFETWISNDPLGS